LFGLLKVEGVLKAKSPIFHGGNEKTGSVVLLNRMKFFVDGEVVEVPYISGNAVRGVWRRLIFKDMLDQIGYEIDVSKRGGLKLYHSLFTGGVLETAEESSGIDIELKRKVLSLIIPARLFGFSFGNQMIEGRLKVGFLLPICTELAGYLPDHIEPKVSFYELIGHTFQTRKDDLRVEREEGEQAIQMLVEYETFIAGTQFYHEVKLEDPTDLDISCLARVIELWKSKPFIGGKSSIGFGELEIDYNLNATSDEYLRFLKDKRDEICSLLKTLENLR